jgi:DNA-binding NarL/FixJ family response regulator
MSIRILLVDDHQMMRDGLRAILDLEDALDVVGEAGNGYEALELAETLRPDVVVMDIGMKDLNGIEATRQIKAQSPQA